MQAGRRRGARAGRKRRGRTAAFTKVRQDIGVVLDEALPARRG
ncbi:MAG: hypothetical protein ACLUHE_09880 [Christensenellales bacterium]